jgi:hypothetical protein
MSACGTKKTFRPLTKMSGVVGKADIRRTWLVGVLVTQSRHSPNCLQLINQLFRIEEIARMQALGEPSINRREQLSGFSVATLPIVHE